MGTNNILIQLKDINKAYDKHIALKNLNLDIYENEFLTLLGPPECGKSALVRILAGFDTPDSGSFMKVDDNLQIKALFERNMNTIFQSYSLFPHMTIYNNMAFGLKLQNIKKSKLRTKIDEILDIVQLTGLENCCLHQLTKYQRQKVALAKALINKPQILLLDEPLEGLDFRLRKEMQSELKHIQKKLGITFIYATNHAEEALSIGGRLVVMNNGSIEQIGSPHEIYEHPETQFVATFTGETNLFEAVIAQIEGNEVLLNLETGCMCGINKNFHFGEMIYISVRPEKMHFGTSAIYQPSLTASITEILYMGPVVKCIAALPNGQEIKIIRLNGAPLPKPGEVINLYWYPEDAVLIRARENILLTMIENMNFENSYIE